MRQTVKNMKQSFAKDVVKLSFVSLDAPNFGGCGTSRSNLSRLIQQSSFTNNRTLVQRVLNLIKPYQSVIARNLDIIYFFAAEQLFDIVYALHRVLHNANLAVGIGIQNFPEGLAVSLPLQAAGFSTLKSFWYGQLSGMVEPLAGVLGAACVTLAAPVLPYALAFAAGAMIYVVIDDIIPEAHQSGNGKLASWGAIAGFLVMMSLDVGLG
ncbi:hypothetical protein TKK_0011516 [Trichogramma kaykai]